MVLPEQYKRFLEIHGDMGYDKDWADFMGEMLEKNAQRQGVSVPELRLRNLLGMAEMPRVLNPGVRVLEIGCGLGEDLVVVARANPAGSFIGVDSNAEYIAAAEVRALEAGLTNVSFYACDSLTFLEGKYEGLTTSPLLPFDVIFGVNGVIGYNGEWYTDQMFRAVKKALKPEGVVCFVVPNALAAASHFAGQASMVETKSGDFILERMYWDALNQLLMLNRLKIPKEVKTDPEKVGKWIDENRDKVKVHFIRAFGPAEFMRLFIRNGMTPAAVSAIFQKTGEPLHMITVSAVNKEPEESMEAWIAPDAVIDSVASKEKRDPAEPSVK